MLQTQAMTLGLDAAQMACAVRIYKLDHSVGTKQEALDAIQVQEGRKKCFGKWWR
jgi:hypothetical protein